MERSYTVLNLFNINFISLYRALFYFFKHVPVYRASLIKATEITELILKFS